jgi:hypothetical protein
MAIPSKLFEYMRHDAALLVLAAPESATYDLVRGTTAEVVAADDVEAIASAIQKHYEEHLAGARATALAVQPRFSRRHQAMRLLDHLDEICDTARARGAAMDEVGNLGDRASASPSSDRKPPTDGNG